MFVKNQWGAPKFNPILNYLMTWQNPPLKFSSKSQFKPEESKQNRNESSLLLRLHFFIFFLFFLFFLFMDHVIRTDASDSPYNLLFKSLSLIPLSHYFLFIFLIFIIFLYNFLEIHFLRDLVTGFRGDPVHLTYSASSKLYQSLAANCHVLHGRSNFQL